MRNTSLCLHSKIRFPLAKVLDSIRQEERGGHVRRPIIILHQSMQAIHDIFRDVNAEDICQRFCPAFCNAELREDERGLGCEHVHGTKCPGYFSVL